MKIKDIKIGKRIRKDMGNLKSLVESIKDIGLLHPIVISPDNELLCGRRRLEALRLLGIDELEEEVHYKIMTVDDFLKSEFEENFCRKDFTPSEALEIWEQSKSYQNTSEIPDRLSEFGHRRDRVAKALGVGKTWLSEAKAVKDSGRKDLVEQMDEGQISVHKAYEELNKNRVPDEVYVNMDTYKKIENGRKTQITKTFGNWKTGDEVELGIARARKIKILSVESKTLGEYTDDDAMSEGFKDLKDMKKAWEKEGLEWRESSRMIILKIEKS